MEIIKQCLLKLRNMVGIGKHRQRNFVCIVVQCLKFVKKIIIPHLTDIKLSLGPNQHHCVFSKLAHYDYVYKHWPNKWKGNGLVINTSRDTNTVLSILWIVDVCFLSAMSRSRMSIKMSQTEWVKSWKMIQYKNNFHKNMSCSL